MDYSEIINFYVKFNDCTSIDIYLSFKLKFLPLFPYQFIDSIVNGIDLKEIKINQKQIIQQTLKSKERKKEKKIAQTRYLRLIINVLNDRFP